MTCGPQMCSAQTGGNRSQTGGNRSQKRVIKRVKKGGCGCNKGGYRATKRDKKYLLLFKKGKSIGFTMRSSLKAKGLIPRANGTRRVSNKYR